MAHRLLVKVGKYYNTVKNLFKTSSISNHIDNIHMDNINIKSDKEVFKFKYTGVIQEKDLPPSYNQVINEKDLPPSYDEIVHSAHNGLSHYNQDLIAQVDASIAAYNLTNARCNLKLQEAKAKYSFLNQGIAAPKAVSSLSPLSNEYLQKISSIPNDEWNPIKWDEDQWNSILLSGNCEEQCIINS